MLETEQDPIKEQEVKNYFVTFVHPDDDCSFADPASKHNTQVRGLRGTSEDDIKGYVATHEEACPGLSSMFQKVCISKCNYKVTSNRGEFVAVPITVIVVCRTN